MIERLISNKRLMMVLAIAWTILIFIGCSLPGKDLPAISVFDHFDKVVHFTFFFVFAVLWSAAFPTYAQQGKSSALKLWVVMIAFSFAYGFALEFYQINFVPGRSFDVWDGIADGIGGIGGCLFAKKIL